MFYQRTLVTLILLPLGLFVIYLGGAVYAIVIALILALAAFEYVTIMRKAGHQPSFELVIGGTLLLAAGRAINGFESTAWITSLIVLVAATYHLVAYERGRDQAGSDLGVSLGGVFYLGWLGAYLISLRDLPEGTWWVLTALPAVWLADSGAYLIGSRFGQHKMVPRLSPKKSWEGYFGGILFSIPLTIGLALLWRIPAGPDTAITAGRAALLALILSILPTLGDLAESMFKRQAGVKDSGNLLPGHGGALDRVDSWLWGAVIGYYVITWLFL